MTRLTDFVSEQLQAALEYDEDDDGGEGWQGGVVTAWVIVVEVMPPLHVSEHPALLALAAENQRKWQTKGLLVEALDMERREEV